MWRSATFCIFVNSVFLIALLPSSASKEICELPYIPTFYSTNLQINYLKVPEIRPHVNSGEIHLPEISVTIDAFETVDESFARALFEARYEFSLGPAITFQINEKIIFNEGLEGVKAFINIGDVNGARVCETDKIHENSLWNIIFNIDPEHPVFPSITHILHFGHEYECFGTHHINGIPTFAFNTIFEDANNNLNVTYYWSDKEVWEGSSGNNRSVPVMATVTGHAKLPPDQTDHRVDVTIWFDNFKEIEPAAYLFNPPSDIWCPGREATRSLPKLPEAFMYNAELVFHWKPEFVHHEIDAIVPMTEYYDYILKASRTDYKPFNYHNISDPFEGNFGFISAVKDFHSGVVYETFQDSMNCSARFSGFDFSGDVTFNPDGSLQMTSPSHLWHMDRKFASNGIHYERGIPMSAYVTSLEQVPPTDGKSAVDYIVVLELTSGKFEEEGDTSLEKKVPVRYEIYDRNYYNDHAKRVRHNIYGLREHRPDYKVFDITACFTGEAIAEKTIRLAYKKEMIVHQNLWQFSHSVRKSIHEAAGITPLRVQRIEVDVVPDEGYIYVSFALVDWPEGVNQTQHPGISPESIFPLNEAVEKLASSISSGAFVVDVQQEGSDEHISSSADSSYFENSRRTPSPPGTTYSPGAMAALGICMLLITFCGSLALFTYFIKW